MTLVLVRAPACWPFLSPKPSEIRHDRPASISVNKLFIPNSCCDTDWWEINAQCEAPKTVLRSTPFGVLRSRMANDFNSFNGRRKPQTLWRETHQMLSNRGSHSQYKEHFQEVAGVCLTTNPATLPFRQKRIVLQIVLHITVDCGEYKLKLLRGNGVLQKYEKDWFVSHTDAVDWKCRTEISSATQINKKTITSPVVFT